MGSTSEVTSARRLKTAPDHFSTVFQYYSLTHMGFGSYDESEQQNHEVAVDDDEVEGVNVHENDHRGEVSFESDASTDELLDQLQDIKSDD